jgi:hypothetical protein
MMASTPLGCIERIWSNVLLMMPCVSRSLPASPSPAWMVYTVPSASVTVLSGGAALPPSPALYLP